MKILRFVPAVIGVLALGVLSVSLPARAADRFWTNVFGGDFLNPFNWSPNIVPGAADNAHFNLTVPAVTWATASRTNANAFFNPINGSLQQLISTNFWLLTNSFVVGQNAGATSTVIHISGALRVTNAAGTGLMIIGQNGRGTYLMQGAASVVADQLFVTNNGAGFTNSTLLLGFGTLTTLHGSQVAAISNYDMGILANGIVTWNMPGGTNRFDIAAAGNVTLGSATNAQVIVNVSGAGTLLTNDGTFIIGGLGNSNAIHVSGGARLASVGATIGNDLSTSNNVISISDTNSTWSNSASVLVGRAGRGNTLVVSNSAAVFSSSLIVGELPSSLSNHLAVSSGNLNVTNAVLTGTLDVRRGQVDFNGGSITANALLMTNASGFFEFNGGRLITRSAIISNGMPFVVGRTGTIASVWDVRTGATNHVLRNSLVVGGIASFNQVFITNGAKLFTFGNGEIGVGSGARSNVIFVAGSGSRWEMETDLRLGVAGAFNRLVVSSGGFVTDEIGTMGGSSTSSSNEVLVTGAGSVWSNLFFLVVGAVGSGNRLSVTSGGTALAGTSILLGSAATSTNNRAIVNGGTLRATNVANAGTLEVRRGTNVFDAGLIEVDRLLITNTLGVFEFNGGTLITEATTHNNGRVFTVGNGTSGAILDLAGNGTHTFVDGLHAANNALLRGNGTLSGVLTVEPGGSLSPGTSIGKLILNNSPSLQGASLMEISKSGGVLTNDQVQVTGSLTYGGSLTVTRLGADAFVVGDSFPLFSASSFGGGFSSVTLPPPGTGLAWTNKLLVDGSIEVFAPAAPQFGSITFNGANVFINGTGGLANNNYIVMTSTNVALPFTNWTPLFTGRFDCSGNFAFSDAIFPAGSPQRFYILSPAFSVASDGIVVVNDIWSDNNRNQPAPPAYSENGANADSDGDLESAWFSSPASDTLFVQPGITVTNRVLMMVQQNGASCSYTTYFTPEANPVTLANPGDELKITWVFTPLAINTNSTSQGFRLAIVDSPAINRVASGIAPPTGAYLGYAMFMNMKSGNLGNGNSFQLRKRAAPGTPASFLVSSGDWTALTNGATAATPGYADSTTCTNVITITRNMASGLDIACTMSQEGLGGPGTNQLEVAFTDAAPDTFAFDTFGLRPSSLEDTAMFFENLLFKVEFNCGP